MEDTNKELERLEKALLEDETLVGLPIGDEDLTEDLPEGLLSVDNEILAEEFEKAMAEEQTPEKMPEVSEPVIDDELLDQLIAEVESEDFAPEEPAVSDETMVFHNFPSQLDENVIEYGEAEPAEDEDLETKKRDDKILVGLMITASVLCLGILGVLGYWLIAFL